MQDNIKENDIETIDSSKRTKCQIVARVMGYYRPISEFNKGKKSEYNERTYFKINNNINTYLLVNNVNNSAVA